MSEIKGQLLGIIIVLMVFAAVGGTMVALFTNFSGSLQNTVNQVVSEEQSEGKTITYSSAVTQSSQLGGQQPG